MFVIHFSISELRVHSPINDMYKPKLAFTDTERICIHFSQSSRGTSNLRTHSLNSLLEAFWTTLVM